MKDLDDPERADAIPRSCCSALRDSSFGSTRTTRITSFMCHLPVRLGISPVGSSTDRGSSPVPHVVASDGGGRRRAESLASVIACLVSPLPSGSTSATVVVPEAGAAGLSVVAVRLAPGRSFTGASSTAQLVMLSGPDRCRCASCSLGSGGFGAGGGGGRGGGSASFFASAELELRRAPAPA